MNRVGQVWETKGGLILLITRSTRRKWKVSHDYLILYSTVDHRVGRFECGFELVNEPWEKSKMQRIA